MASASLQSHGVKIPCHGFITNSNFSSNRLSFSSSVASHSRLCAAIEDCCRAKAMKVVKMCAKKGVEAVLKDEKIEKQFSNGNVENFTCVMKFGGSSVSSAERMREIATLILSFPQERPVVVLSAMGKTTNKLLLVIYTFYIIKN
jgi:aspartate kinase